MCTHGPCPAGEAAVFTYVRLNCERGSAYVRFRWEEGKLAGIRDVAPVGTSRFLPESAELFNSFSLTSPTAVRLSFKPGPDALDGKAACLILHTSAGDVLADRAE